MRAKQVRSPHRSFRLYLGYTWREEEEKERVDEDVGGREAEVVVAVRAMVVVKGRRWGG